MNNYECDDATIYKVLVNNEGQYSIWPVEGKNPLGWSDTGETGLKSECLDYIQEVWTALTPLTVRKRTEPRAIH